MRYLIFLIASLAQAANFQLANIGCSMAHCNPQLTGAVGITLPSKFQFKFNDSSGDIGGFGLGCSSNGTIFGCNFTSQVAIIGKFDINGNLIGGGNLVYPTNLYCAPMIAVNGEIITCDEVEIIRLNATGSVMWDTCFYGGDINNTCFCPDGVHNAPCSLSAGQNYPSSPTQIANGSIVLATGGSSGHGGKVFNFNSSTGAIISSVYLDKSGNDSYITTNTPCVSPTEDGGNRVFIITNWSADTTRARMYALTIGSNSITTAWKYPSSGDFTGPSQSSPLCASGGVFTDAIDTNNAAKGAVWGWSQHDGSLIFSCDTGSSGTGCPMTTSKINGAFPLDPRNDSFWLFWGGGQTYQRRSIADGSVLQTISMGSNYIPGESCGVSPSSATLTAKDSYGNAYLITSLISSTGCGGGAYLVAINTLTGVISKYFQIENNVNNAVPGYPVGQYAFAKDPTSGEIRIGFGTSFSGLTLVGDIFASHVVTNGVNIGPGVVIQ